MEIEKLKQKKKDEIFSKKEVAEKTELKRDTTPMFDYYKAWDKFATTEEKNKKEDDEEEVEEILEAKNPVPEAEKQYASQAEML